MIIDLHEIHALVGRLIKERVPVTVLLPAREGFFSSVLLTLERESSVLTADELFPARGHAAMEPGTELRILARLDGIEMRFRTDVIAITSTGSSATYQLRVPTALDYMQRRTAFRVPVSPALAIPVLIGGDGVNAAGTLVDISHGGLRVALRGQRDLPPAESFNCRIGLPAEPVLAEVEPCHTEPDRRGLGVVYIGLRFLNLSRDQQRVISRFTANIQRDQLRARRLYSQ